MNPEILPGILTHNLDEYVSRLTQVERAGIAWAHIDVMDGQFVPNITVMPHEFMGVGSSVKLEAHLMTFKPERYYSDLVVASVQRILVHRECFDSLEQTAEAIKHARDYFPEVGLVYNPDTAIEPLKELGLSVVMCMGVHPGASGQPFIESTKDAVKRVAEQQLNIPIAADGGVGEETIQSLYTNGVRRFVISSRLFSSFSLKERAQEFTNLAQSL